MMTDTLDKELKELSDSRLKEIAERPPLTRALKHLEPGTVIGLSIVERDALIAQLAEAQAEIESQKVYLQRATETRRDMQNIIRGWQKHAERTAKLLGCIAIDDEIEAALARLKAKDEWQPIEEFKEHGTFQVWLESPDPVMGSQIGIANFHPNVTTVSGHFAYDMPKILYVRPLPPAPEMGGAGELQNYENGKDYCGDCTTRRKDHP